MTRRWAIALLLAMPLLAGCLDLFGDEEEREVTPPDVGYDASQLEITDVRVHDLTITSHDGTELDAIVYEPVAQVALDDGAAPVFPVVVFLHSWGESKEMYEYLPLDNGNPVPLPPTNLLDEFARAGLIAVAYDARGWYASGGENSIAGPAEVADIDAVMDHVAENFATNGRFGVTGLSYGGGQAFLAWAKLDRVVTAVPHDGWVDLYEGVVPGNVPKLEWGASLYAGGLAGTGVVRMDDAIHRWLASALTRTDLDEMEDEMDLRSIMTGEGVQKPLFTCQSLQETLFPQSHLAWATAPGFTRAVYHTGGHGTLDRQCWTQTRQWFQFFLAGVDTQVDAWPPLRSADHSGNASVSFAARPAHADSRYFLRAPGLVEYDANETSFTIDQRLLANPFHEPSVVWDALGAPFEPVPAQLRQDPTAVMFESGTFSASQVILGAPTLVLNATDATRDGPWQVVATLYRANPDGLLLLGRGAYAVVEPDDHDNGTVTLSLPWMKADIDAGDRIVLKIASNDPTVFAPLLADYSVTFNGTSSLTVPFYDPQTTRSG